jgi:anaerobic ribonucleoside-triphosphate reductase
MTKQLQPIAVRKRDGSLEDFSQEEIYKRVELAVRDVGGEDFDKAKKLTKEFSYELAQDDRIINTSEIDSRLFDFFMNKDYDGTAWASKIRAKQKERSIGNIAVLGSTSTNGKGSTDSFLMVGSSSKETATKWNRNRIIASLINEAELDLGTAKSVGEETETTIFSSGVPHITTQLIREVAHTELIKRNLTDAANNYKNYGLPRADLEEIIHSRIKENSNVQLNNPEAINFGIAGNILKAWALSSVFSPDVAEAHSSGAVHLHDLDMPTRLYCSAHSIEYMKKYGLDLPTSSSTSKPAKHADVLIGHLNTFLATYQAFYAGALGVGDINVFFAPHIRKDLEGEGMKKVNALKGKLEKDKDRLAKQRLNGKKGISVLESVIREDEKAIAELEKDPMYALTEEEIQKELKQQAQKLVFNGSQNAFSRGGQTLFLDFNIHADVPKHLRNTPIILDGKYQLRTLDGLIALEERKLEEKTRSGYNLMELVDPRNGKVVLREKIKVHKDKETLIQEEMTKEGEHVSRYGDPENRVIARRLTRALLEVYGEGDSRGAPFAFPKCDFHANEDTLSGRDDYINGTMQLTYDLASKNGATYFVFDRDAVTMSACCRLRTTIDDDYVIKHPESMRFCGFQNVTMNLAQAAYRAKRRMSRDEEDAKGKNLETLFYEEVDKVMDLAAKAHLQKKAKIEGFMEEGGPQYSIGKIAKDGVPYVDLEKATYIMGINGLNEACQFLMGRELHEMTGEELKKWGLGTIAHMNVKAKQLTDGYKLKFSLEESPAESATKRLASMDVIRFPESRDYVKGNLDTGVVYYTNSNHLAAEAPVDIVTRIRRQGIFHPAIDSGAITHAFVGEERPSPEAIKHLVEKTFYDTQTAQLTISPEFTVCENCDTTHAGLLDNCPSCDSDDVYSQSRIVGYYSTIRRKGDDRWIDSKIEELARRHVGNYSVMESGSNALEMPKLIGSEAEREFVTHTIGKPGCDACERLQGEVKKVQDYYSEKGIKVKHMHHDVYTDDGMVELLASGINPSRIPGVIVMNNDQEVYRHSVDWGQEKGSKFVRAKNLIGSIDEYINAHTQTSVKDDSK